MDHVGFWNMSCRRRSPRSFFAVTPLEDKLSVVAEYAIGPPAEPRGWPGPARSVRVWRATWEKSSTVQLSARLCPWRENQPVPIESHLFPGLPFDEQTQV